MEFKFDLEIAFCTLFKEIQESSPSIYATNKCNNFGCVNMYYVMHMTRGLEQIKFGEIYAKSAKTGQSSLENRIIWFCQQNHKNQNIWFLKPEHPIFSDSTY
jgi:hypothetical protein